VASISFLTLSTFLSIAGFMPPPDDILNMICAWVLLAWFSMAVGLVVGSLSTASESVDRVWHVISYLFLPLSGALFMVDWLPKRVQELALFIPTVNCTELLREGYFGTRIHAHYDLSYLIVVNVALTLIGLIAVKRISGMVEGE